jgi:alpha-tubulin suppressor-like RCC1 family protein
VELPDGRAVSLVRSSIGRVAADAPCARETRFPVQRLQRATVLVGAILAVAVVAAAASGGAEISASLVGSTTLTPATAIEVSGSHSCALTRAGGAKCWGSNEYSQLGDGTTLDRSSPVDVSGLSSGLTAIAAGSLYSCARTSRGGVKCWGWNRRGELGDGTTIFRSTPVDVSGLGSGVTAIAVGDNNNCALTTSGAVKCWGGNPGGGLGDGTTTDRWTPVDVVGLSGSVTAISVGGVHGCALTSGGGVKCWGANYWGALGDGTTVDRWTPVDVVGLSSGVTAISAGGGHTCALMSSGGVKCWGRNESGQLGDGTITDRLAPVDVSGLSSGVTAIGAGSDDTCALTSGGGVKCWGLNSDGQLGNGQRGFDPATRPVDVVGLSSGVTAISVGSIHSCALTHTGGVACWGVNASGQLGDGTTTDRPTPVGVIGFGTPNATLTIVSRSLVATPGRIAAIRLRCGAQARCRGTLTLTASVAGELVGSSARRVRVTLGTRTFSITRGATQPVVVMLSPRRYDLLVRAKRLSAQARASYQQTPGLTVTTARTITLTAPEQRVKRP